MCNNDRLSVGEFEEWHYYNPIIDRYLMLKDTLIEDSANGKKYRVEIGVDISEERTQDGVIQKYQNMEFIQGRERRRSSVPSGWFHPLRNSGFLFSICCQI